MIVRRTPSTLRVSALAKLPERFHDLPGARRVDAILSLEDPTAFIQDLAPDELYMLVADIGVSDSTQLIGMSTTDQRRAFVDLDAWRGDELDGEAFDEWLSVFLEVSPELAMETLDALDPELIVDYLLTQTHLVLDRTEEDDINQYQNAWNLQWTPDHEFCLVLALHVDTVAQANVNRLLDLLYRHSNRRARSILFSMRGGMRIEQEEMAFQFRASRLSDLGFVSGEQAHELWAPIRLEGLKKRLAEQATPGIPADLSRMSQALVRASTRGSFLNDCLAGAADPERWIEDFALCFNRGVVASPEGIVLRNPSRLEEIGRRIHSTVNLGLEELADGDLERGTALLDQAWCLQLHQVGHALTVVRARRATALQARGGELFDAGTNKVLMGLKNRPTPLRYDGDDDGYNAFETVEQLRSVDGVLDAAEALCDLFEQRLGFSLSALGAHEFAGLTEDDRLHIDFEVLARTALAHVVAGGDPSFEPLKAEAVQALVANSATVGTRAAELASTLGGGPADALLSVAADGLRRALAGTVDHNMLSTEILIDKTAEEIN